MDARTRIKRKNETREREREGRGRRKKGEGNNLMEKRERETFFVSRHGKRLNVEIWKILVANTSHYS